jgi:hypothetical protein
MAEFQHKFDIEKPTQSEEGKSSKIYHLIIETRAQFGQQRLVSFFLHPTLTLFISTIYLISPFFF